MKKLEIIIRPEKLHGLREALVRAGICGLSVWEIRGFGRQRGYAEVYRTITRQADFRPKIRVETVVEDSMVETAIAAVREAVATGAVGDGKIFVLPVEEAVRIRTGERGEAAVKPLDAESPPAGRQA